MKSMTVKELENFPGFVTVTAVVRLKDGKELYLCDEWDELVEALGATDTFMAHEVVGSEPAEVVINPAWVATMQSGR